MLFLLFIIKKLFQFISLYNQRKSAKIHSYLQVSNLKLVPKIEEESKMILDLEVVSHRQVKQKTTWKQELKRYLYRQNAGFMKTSKPTFDNNETIDMTGEVNQKIKYEIEIKRLEQKLLRSITNTDNIEINQKFKTSNGYGYYSYYILIQNQIRSENQLLFTFPYIRRMSQNDKNNQKSLLLTEISEHIKFSVDRRQVDLAWANCLRKYICNIDSIRAIEIYLEIKKKGGARALRELHRTYGQGCSLPIFFQRVQFSKIFIKKNKNSLIKGFSIQNHEIINEISLSKTMKQLFCCICSFYDCNQHFLDDSLKEKNYTYVSPRSVVTENDHIISSTDICLAYSKLTSKGFTCDDPQEQKIACSQKCFKNLTTQKWQILRNSRGILLSPIVKSIIKMGIELYSYCPCLIWGLIEDKRITCSYIFLFFMEDYNLLGRLEQKLKKTQVQRLMKQPGVQRNDLKPISKKEKRINIANNLDSSIITSCFHCFIGQDQFDINCDQCDCRKRKFCIPQCLCSQHCPLRKKGCNCKNDCQTDKCNCFRNNSQCDPNLCRRCCDDTKKQSIKGSKLICKNHQIADRQMKKTRIGKSTIIGAGLGLFAAENIKKDQLITIYCGEMIDQSIELMRQQLKQDGTLYNFLSQEGPIDARYMGNKSRFINHGQNEQQNVYSLNKLSEGRYYVAFYAKRDIDEHEELFFNYDGNGEISKNYLSKYPFIAKAKTK